MNADRICIALVEDNPDLRDDLQFQLAGNGNEVTAMVDGEALDLHLCDKQCNIIVLDIGLPGEDGLSIAGRLRHTHPEIGIIILTARGELETRLQGFDRGADVYLVKPVNWRELEAQIYALHRRLQPVSQHSPQGWVLRQFGRELVNPEGQSIPLTHMEGQVLTVLAQRFGETVERQTLIRGVAAADVYMFDPRRLEVCISRLRQKMLDAFKANGIADATGYQLPLKTVRSIGYVFTQPIHIVNLSS